MKTELIEYVNNLKKAGLKVYALDKDQSNFIFIENDSGQIGYCQLDRLEGFCFSTVHKPCKSCGTGFSIHRDIYNPTIQHAKDSFALCPDWATSSQIKDIKKYKSFSDKEKNSILNYKEV